MLVLAALIGIVFSAHLIGSQGAEEQEPTGVNRQETAQDFPQLSEEDDDEELYKFLASSAWYDYQATAFQFAKAFFSADTDKIKSFLVDPAHEDYFPTEKRSLDNLGWFVIKIESLQFRYSETDGKRIERIYSEIEISDVRYDSIYYLGTDMILYDGKWKVIAYGGQG
jgi:hypothetical protein